MIVCAGKSESFPFAKAMGIGLIEMSINLTEQCLRKRPEFLLFVGSAGSYGEHEIFEIVESKSAANIENGFFNAGAYSPIDNMVSTAQDVSRETIVNSSNYITTDSSLAQAYIDKGIGLENMEFYAVLKVAQRFNIPAGGVFVVTNRCDKHAHQTFIQNHKEAMLRLTAYMEKKVRNNEQP